MSLRNAFRDHFKLAHPIVQAPMGGGATTLDLVATVCNAGALGFLAAAYLSPSQIESESRDLRARTSRPFGINLFAPLPAQESAANIGDALAHLAPFHAELGLGAPSLSPQPAHSFNEQLAAVLNSGATVFSFTFGIPEAGDLELIRSRGMYIMGTCTTVCEAQQLESAGVDAIVAQGSEAGAHRGTFAGDFGDAMVGTMALVPQTVDAVKIPVLASGGIMDGRGVAAALALGAQAVQMGTAFLTCHEAGIPESYKQAILQAKEDETGITRTFSGRPARGIKNRFSDSYVAEPAQTILPYPQQNRLTRELRNAAARQDRAEYLSLWAGQGVRLARRQSAADLINRLAKETEVAIDRLAKQQTQEQD